jgi:Zn-dependent protease with chaperone function
VIEFDAIFYDGKTSTRNAVRVRGFPRSLRIVGAEFELEVPLAAVRVEPPVAGTRRLLHLPGGAQLQTDDAAALRALFPRSNPLETWVHGLEGRWAYALAAVAVAAGFTWWCVVYGLPLAAELAAAHVPTSIEAKLGDRTLESIDQTLCGPTAIDAGKQGELSRNFAALTAGQGDGYAYRLEFRACKGMGPNAFALPGGAVVLTDALVKLAQNDAQISAVLAHEVGHVRHRHGLRLAIQAAGLAALIATLAGDAVSITGLAVTLPTALLQSGYSREFEDEADAYAFRRLKEIKLSPKYFAQILARIEESRNKDLDANRDGGPERRRSDLGYLSTHPATAERIARALKNQ